MHGDVHHAADEILTKKDYEFYYRTHEHFTIDYFIIVTNNLP